jgi:hypothetical protein
VIVESVWTRLMVVCVRALWAIAWEFVGRNGRLNGRQVGGRGRVSSSQQE